MSSNPLGALLGSLLGGGSGGAQGSGGGNLLGSLLQALGGGGQQGQQGGGLGGALGGLLGGGGGGQQGQQSNNPLSGLLGFLDSDQADPAVREKAQSWVQPGANQDLTPDEVTRIVPADALHQAAQENGLTDEQAADEIARTLPQAVDRATPHGADDLNRSLEDVVNEVVPGGWGQGGQKAA
ncbi:YidB family protein [Streptomyces coryli]|nr:YidB family protein [Streptomyces coryli]